MVNKPWHGSNWPKGVPHEISGYKKPLFSILDGAVNDYPDATYTIFNNAIRTFAQVKDTADRIASFLASQGIKPGDRVGIFLPNIPHYPAIFFGILKAGAVCVTCNPLYKSTELNFQLKDSGTKAVFVMDHPRFYDTALKAMEGTDVSTVVICNVKSYLTPVSAFFGALLGKIPKAKYHEPDHFMFDDVTASFRPEPPSVDIDAMEDNALILYTGGTTGIPKGACLTHANLLSDVMITDEWIRLSHGPGEPARKLIRGGTHTFLGVLPWYHSFGLTLAMLTSCITASRLVCIPDPRAGKPPFTDVLKAIERHRATIVIAVPTIYSAIVNHALTDRFDLTSLMVCGSGAAPLPGEVISQFEKRTGAIIFEGYGLTETSPVITVNPSNLEQRRIGSAGLPLPGVDIIIVDMDVGMKKLNQGEDGEITVNGPQVMKGYWNNAEENEAAFRQIDGKRYLLTGDIGHIDEDGFIIITDRKKDLILVSGFNAYPADIEDILYSHTKVEMAAVIGVPDPMTGEAVKAFIKLKADVEATEDEILEFCSTKMAGYKRPREIEFRDELPISVVGKVLRRVLRDEELKKRERGEERTE
ncbi:MAG: long-chain fatty acid--CoA ligase [Deltaproteobacteria bacterium]|nr:long-chain fatty acid--CoA ligase [Deltaproteobacteria bacterium]